MRRTFGKLSGKKELPLIPYGSWYNIVSQKGDVSDGAVSRHLNADYSDEIHQILRKKGSCSFHCHT